MKAPITLSINPWYYCNFRCNFCYLTEDQLKDKTTLKLDKLEQLLEEVNAEYNIVHIDLYGGEVFLLPKEYLYQLKDILLKYVDQINVNTNLSLINELVLDPSFYISVSYDFEAREMHEMVMSNMLKLRNPFSILMLGSPVLLSKPVDKIITFFNIFSQLKTVEVKPYSSNQANDLQVSFSQYEEFVKNLIDSPIKKNFEITNELLLDDVLSGQRNAFSDDHLYITPNGEFAVLEFDENDREYFLPMSSLKEYQNWTVSETIRVSGNSFCIQCEYFGGCLSEHLRTVKSLDNSCNGFYKLIEWRKGINNGH